MKKKLFVLLLYSVMCQAMEEENILSPEEIQNLWNKIPQLTSLEKEKKQLIWCEKKRQENTLKFKKRLKRIDKKIIKRALEINEDQVQSLLNNEEDALFYRECIQLNLELIDSYKQHLRHLTNLHTRFLTSLDRLELTIISSVQSSLSLLQTLVELYLEKLSLAPANIPLLIPDLERQKHT